LLRAGDEGLLAFPLSKDKTRMNKDCEACSTGELSDEGMYQLQRLGDAHRRRYVHALGLLPPCVADGAALVGARSSPFARTVQSCRAYLDGLYGSCGDGISIAVGTEKQETLLPHSMSCPRIGELCGLLWTNMPSLLRLQPQQLHALDVARLAMDPVHERSRQGFIGMFDCIHSRSFHGCDLPTAVSSDIAATIAATAAQQLNVMFSPLKDAPLSELPLLSSGPLMVDIENILLPKEAGSNPRGSGSDAVFHIMLGHDITVLPLMASLRLRGCDGASLLHEWPPFASALVFEKWCDGKGQAWAQVTYNGTPCVVGDAVAQQVLHPLLQQPMHLFPMEMLEQTLEQVQAPPPPTHSHPAIADQRHVPTCLLCCQHRPTHAPVPAVHIPHQEVRPQQPVPRARP
jgi:hypothetical protein